MTTLNRKADLLILITCWIFFIRSIAGLKLNRLIIDSPVKNGSSIWLRCDFQLDEAERRAFTSKFYKNNLEFYRYSVSSDRPKPVKKYFVQSAIHVNMNRSNGSHVYVENVEPLTEGTYSCEINTDEPFFMSMQAQQDLRVYVLPKSGLQLLNVRESYRDGDFVNIQCRSAPSKPSMVLRWHINGQQITKDEENLNVTYQTLDQDSINGQQLDGLSYASSNLSFYLCANTSSSSHTIAYQMRPTGRARSGRLPCVRRGRIGQWLRQHNGALYVRCTAVLSQIMDETAEELIFEEKGQSARTEQSGNLESLKPPQIRGTSHMRYQIGDQLQLNCSSGGQSLPAPYLEWFVNNRRINEQYVHNYARPEHWQQAHLGKQSVDLRPANGRSPNGKPSVAGHSSSDVQMPESNVRSSSSLSKSSPHSRSPPTTAATNDKNKNEFQNDYLFSNYLKKLNLLSLQQRNKNNSSLSLSGLLQSDNNLTLSALFAHPNASAAGTFNQQAGIYNNNVNLTRLQNTIYQHYADYSLKPAQHRAHNIGIRFRVMKKHYQTLDFALRVKCVATYGRIIAQDQSTVALFADGRASQYLNALEISAASTCYSSVVPVILLSMVHLISQLSRDLING